jgi:hypothetical protein
LDGGLHPNDDDLILNVGLHLDGGRHPNDDDQILNVGLHLNGDAPKWWSEPRWWSRTWMMISVTWMLILPTFRFQKARAYRVTTTKFNSYSLSMQAKDLIIIFTLTHMQPN